VQQSLFAGHNAILPLEFQLPLLRLSPSVEALSNYLYTMARQRSKPNPKPKQSVRRKMADESRDLVLQLQSLSLPGINATATSTSDPEVLPTPDPRPVPRVKKSRGSKTIKIYRGFRYCLSWKSSKNLVYRCSTARSSGCKAVLKIRGVACTGRTHLPSWSGCERCTGE
jgi:hypothetical protein